MTLEQAEKAFKKYNGSSFQMSREEPALYNDFSSSNISRQQKDQWRLELAQEHLDKIRLDPTKGWMAFSDLAEVLMDIRSFNDRQEELLLEAIGCLEDHDEASRTISLETICGRTYDHHDGVIAYFKRQGYDRQRLKEAADRLIGQDSDDRRHSKAVSLYRFLIG